MSANVITVNSILIMVLVGKFVVVAVKTTSYKISFVFIPGERQIDNMNLGNITEIVY